MDEAVTDNHRCVGGARSLVTGVLGARHSAGHGKRTVSLTHPRQTPGTPFSSFWTLELTR